MSSSTTLRKPLGIRATPKEHKLITQAAKREHRSVNSFVLSAALNAAQSKSASSMRTPEEVDAALRHAQELMRPFRQAGHSMVDELIAERRAEAARE
jgi:hypothetical protein